MQGDISEIMEPINAILELLGGHSVEPGDSLADLKCSLNEVADIAREMFDDLEKRNRRVEKDLICDFNGYAIRQKQVIALYRLEIEQNWNNPPLQKTTVVASNLSNTDVDMPYEEALQVWLRNGDCK